MRQALLGNHRPALETIDGILQLVRPQGEEDGGEGVNFLVFFL